MKLTCLFLLTTCIFIEVASGLSLKKNFPRARRCGVQYDMILKDRMWPCNDPKYKGYPGTKIDNVLYSGLNDELAEYLNVTKNCQAFNDRVEIYGNNSIYSFRSICKMLRRKVDVMWAKVPGYALTKKEMKINSGLLPVHVIEGQSLYDVECVHPWSDGLPKTMKPKTKKRLRGLKWPGVKRYFCKIGYLYNLNYVCTPSGFINREILVYSVHANKLFLINVPNVPTACSCTKCVCKGGGGGGRRSFFG